MHNGAHIPLIVFTSNARARSCQGVEQRVQKQKAKGNGKGNNSKGKNSGHSFYSSLPFAAVAESEQAWTQGESYWSQPWRVHIKESARRLYTVDEPDSWYEADWSSQ